MQLVVEISINRFASEIVFCSKGTQLATSSLQTKMRLPLKSPADAKVITVALQKRFFDGSSCGAVAVSLTQTVMDVIISVSSLR